MIISRTYHSLHLDHTDNGSDKLFYILLPKELETADKEKLEAFSNERQVNFVLVSGFDWDSSMTPWKAQDIFKKSKTYEGNAKAFLEELERDLAFNIEHSMKNEKPDRFLIGISLSGLFALWSTTQRNLFQGIASISGSFWYEGFTEWFREQEIPECGKYYFSLGEKEKVSKNKTLAEVETETEKIVSHLKENGKEVLYETNGYDHFTHIAEKIMTAIGFLASDQAQDQ